MQSQDPIQPQPCTARRKNGEPCGAKAIRGGSVCRMHGGGAPQVKAAAAARLRAMVDPALGVLEYAMKRKDKDLRGALAAAKEVLDRAKPVDDDPRAGAQEGAGEAQTGGQAESVELIEEPMSGC